MAFELLIAFWLNETSKLCGGISKGHGPSTCQAVN